MPSWNIHLAHTQHLLDTVGAAALGVGDINCFAFGNVVPDVYVGYMVAPITKHIRYHSTHFTNRDLIPVPEYQRFWESYVCSVPRGPVRDVALGAWAHLVTDAVYNQRTRRFLAEHGIEQGEPARIAKQADFAYVGTTLKLTAPLEATPQLLDAAQRFPQYSIASADAMRAVAVANEFVAQNVQNETNKPLDPQQLGMLDPAFFSAAWEETQSLLVQGLSL